MRALVPGQLNCGNHPFFIGLFPLLGDIESWYDKVLSDEGNIFEACTVSWSRLKKIIFEGLWSVASAVEGQDATEIPQEIILELVEAVIVVKS